MNSIYNLGSLELLSEIFTSKIPLKVLLYLGNCHEDQKIYIRKLSKQLKIEYSFLVKVLITLEKKGLILKESSGRKIVISLTPQGKEVVYEINKIESILKNENRKRN